MIYMDNSATTKVDKEVIDEMMPYFNENFGNASSVYSFGEKAREAVENSRKKIANFLNAAPEEIIFTSGGTESNNTAIIGAAYANKSKGMHVITSKIEHPSVINTCKFLEKNGFKVTYIDVDKNGTVKIDDFKKALSKDTILVSIMHVNNEIGTIQPVEEIAQLCRKAGVLFHTDAVQSFGKIRINAKEFDMLSASGHKINGPKGIGILYLKKGTNIIPLLNGGGQEFGKRSGTENVPGIVGIGKAVELAEKKMKNSNKIKGLRDKMIKEIMKIKGTRLNGSLEKRIFNNINVSFEGIEGEALVLLLDSDGIYASTGSACSSHSLKPSAVLKALGLSDLQAHSSLRLTLGWGIKEKDAEQVVKKVAQAINKLRRIST